MKELQVRILLENGVTPKQKRANHWPSFCHQLRCDLDVGRIRREVAGICYPTVLDPTPRFRNQICLRRFTWNVDGVPGTTSLAGRITSELPSEMWSVEEGGTILDPIRD